MRPEISDQLAAEVDDAVRGKVRVPPDRLTFADRVRILAEEYDDRVDEVEELRARLESVKSDLADERERRQELEQQLNSAGQSSTTGTGTVIDGDSLNQTNRW